MAVKRRRTPEELAYDEEARQKFVRAWCDRYGGKEVGVRDLLVLIGEEGLGYPLGILHGPLDNLPALSARMMHYATGLDGYKLDGLQVTYVTCPEGRRYLLLGPEVPDVLEPAPEEKRENIRRFLRFWLSHWGSNEVPVTEATFAAMAFDLPLEYPPSVPHHRFSWWVEPCNTFGYLNLRLEFWESRGGVPYYRLKNRMDGR